MFFWQSGNIQHFIYHQNADNADQKQVMCIARKHKYENQTKIEGIRAGKVIKATDKIS